MSKCVKTLQAMTKGVCPKTRKVVICGATGNQGSGVLAALQAEPSCFSLRAITRDTNSEKARALAAQGVEVVAATYDDPTSLKEAFKDAWAVFAVTNYMDPDVMTQPGKEIQQGKRLADAAKEAGVKTFIWSSLDNIAKDSKGKYPGVHSFNNKNEVEQYIKSIGLNAVFVYAGFYASNFTTMMGPHPGGPDGKTPTWYLPIEPQKVVPIADVPTQMGAVVAAVLCEPKKYHGQRIDIAPSYMKMEDLPKIYTKVTGKPAAYVYVPMEEWKKNLPEGPLRDFLSQMLGHFQDFGYYGGRSLTGLPEGVSKYGWEEYLVKSGWKAQV